MAFLIFGILVLVLSVWTIWALAPVIAPPVLQWLGYQYEVGSAGQWGDTFGALNALFAALGFTAVILTLRQQQHQINAAQDDQHRQRFESSYFELLRLLREARKEIRFQPSSDFSYSVYHESPRSSEGLAAFKTAWEEAFYWIDLRGDGATKEQVGEIYNRRIHERIESDLGPYFRILYTMLHRLRSDRVLTEEEKHRYGNLLRSQLTSFELALAGLNGLSSVSKDFGDLVTEFRLLKYLPEGKRRQTLKRYYPKQAFEARD